MAAGLHKVCKSAEIRRLYKKPEQFTKEKAGPLCGSAKDSKEDNPELGECPLFMLWESFTDFL